jgi:Putative auto-transporter adhesin, head GIN domain
MLPIKPRLLLCSLIAILILPLASIGKPVTPAPKKEAGDKKEPGDKKDKESAPAPKTPDATFTTIVFEGAGNLVIRQSAKEGVTQNGMAGADQSRVENGVLYLGGAGNFEVDAKHLTKVVLKAAGNLEAKDLNLKTLEITLEGAGNINLAGTVEEQTINLGGAGVFDCMNLKGKRATVNVSGAGNAVVQVSEVLQANISGAGNVEYVARPSRVEENITGAGQVQQYVPSSENP